MMYGIRVHGKAGSFKKMGGEWSPGRPIEAMFLYKVDMGIRLDMAG
jgi:hypothetical protein